MDLFLRQDKECGVKEILEDKIYFRNFLLHAQRLPMWMMKLEKQREMLMQDVLLMM